MFAEPSEIKVFLCIRVISRFWLSTSAAECNVYRMVGNNLFIILIGAQITGHYLLCCWLLQIEGCIWRKEIIECCTCCGEKEVLISCILHLALEDLNSGAVLATWITSWCRIKTWKRTLVSMLYTSRRWRWAVAHKINDIAVQLGLTSLRAYRGPESDRSHQLRKAAVSLWLKKKKKRGTRLLILSDSYQSWTLRMGNIFCESFLEGLESGATQNRKCDVIKRMLESCILCSQ